MDWVIFAGAWFSFALVLIGLSAWWSWGLRKDRRPFVCFLLTAILCLVAWSLAPSFVGFRLAPFELYDVRLPFVYIAYLYFYGIFFPDTIVILVLAIIPAALGLYFLIKTR